MKRIPIFSNFPPLVSLQADYFYVVAAGQFEVTVADVGNE